MMDKNTGVDANGQVELSRASKPQPSKQQESEEEEQRRDSFITRPRDVQPILEDIPEPPDGGWGWFIVLASFMCNTVVDGVSYSFGILLIDLVNYYKSQKGETAWIGSLLSGVFLGSGFLVGPLTNRFGCRPVAMTGSVIAAFAFLLSTVAPNVQVLFFTYGIMGGIGFGMIYLPSIVSVGYYFSTKRAFATGIATCGSGMGAFVFAPLTQKLLETYDWRGALVIIAGLALNCMVFGAIMRPLEAKRKRKISRPTRSFDSNVDTRQTDPLLLDTTSNTEPGVHSTFSVDEIGRIDGIQQFLKMPGGPMKENKFRRNSEIPIPSHGCLISPINGDLAEAPADLTTNGKISECRSQICMQDYLHNSCITTNKQGSAHILCPTSQDDGYTIQKCEYLTTGCGRHRRILDPKDLKRPLYRKDIFYSGNITHLPEFKQSRNDVRTYVAHVLSVPSLSDTNSSDAKKKVCPRNFRIPKTILDSLRINLDYSLFRNPSFFLACVSNIFGMMGFYIVWVYLADSSIYKGVPEEHASYLISIMGIMNLVGKIVFGWIVDWPRVRSMDMNNLCLVVSGIAVASVPFCFSYTAIAAAISFFSIFAGAYISLISIVLVDMLGLDKLTNSFGMLSLFRGAGSIIGPPIAGTVFDYTGSYDIPFFLAGGLLLSAAAFTSIIPCLSICNRNKNRQTLSRRENGVKAPLEMKDRVVGKL